jgi:hypothetical protein
MAGLKDVFKDIMAHVNTDTCIDYVRVWNNQVELSEQGQMYSFPNLACFVEIVPQRGSVGLGISAGDLTVKFHIVHVQLDAGNDEMDQNLEVFEYRDSIIRAFTYYESKACSGFQLVNEQPDYGHSNVYHYIVEFVCQYVDDKGDVLRTYLFKQPTTDLSVTGEIDN